MSRTPKADWLAILGFGFVMGIVVVMMTFSLASWVTNRLTTVHPIATRK